jgi:NitT/TauT family transport system substrate-binding protein
MDTLDYTMVRRRTYLKGVGTGAALGVTGLAGCLGDGGNSAGNETTTTGGDQQKYTGVTLGSVHFPTIPHGFPLEVARRNGYYEEYGIEVNDIVSPKAGSAGHRVIASGEVSAAVLGPPGAVSAYMHGSPVYIAANANPVPQIDFTTRYDSDIEKIQDLVGGTIAVTSPASGTEGLAKLSVMRADGISLDDVEIMYAGGLGEAFAAMKEGVADVCLNTPPTNVEMFENNEARRVWKSNEFVPHYPEDVFLMGGPAMDNKPELGRGLLNAWIDAVNFIRDNVEETASMWADAADMDEQIALLALKDVNPDEFYGLELTQNHKDTITEFMRVLELLDKDKDPPWDEVYRPELIPEGRSL